MFCWQQNLAKFCRRTTWSEVIASEQNLLLSFDLTCCVGVHPKRVNTA